MNNMEENIVALKYGGVASARYAGAVNTKQERQKQLTKDEQELNLRFIIVAIALDGI